jgi:hypothetical protein
MGLNKFDNKSTIPVNISDKSSANNLQKKWVLVLLDKRISDMCLQESGTS